MSNYYNHSVLISYEEIAEQLSGEDMMGVSRFLQTLASKLKARYTPDEEKIIALLPEDIYFGAIAEGLVTSVQNAQDKLKAATRAAFAQPTHEQIQEQIADLMKRRNERIAREIEEAKKTEANYEALLPKFTEQEQNFCELCEKTPIAEMTFDGRTIVVVHRDNTLRQTDGTLEEFNTMLTIWERWKDTQKLKALKAEKELPISRVAPAPEQTTRQAQIDRDLETLISNQKRHMEWERQNDLDPKSPASYTGRI